MSKEKKKQQPDRRANRTILGRTMFLLVMFGIVAFIPLFVTLYDIQIRQHKDLEAKALEQQTSDLSVTANRGYIYDSKGLPLAMSATVHRIFISPKELLECQQNYRDKVKERAEKGEDPLTYPEPTPEFIARNLAEILGVDEERILKRMEKTNSMYEELSKSVEEPVYQAVLKFVSDNHITGIYYPPTAKRYYPNGSLASQVIGWVNPNDNNRGAYGLEAVYEEELAGQTGRVVTAKNGAGTQMLYRFEDYYDAVDGNNLTITIDKTIQYYCERVLEKGISMYDVQNGGFAIAMDPNTGAILAWANSPSYDLNNPWAITDPTLATKYDQISNDATLADDERKKQLGDLQYEQWRNKAIVDTYEPGSTFKSIVLASALEEGVVNENTGFTCTGSVMVADWPIRCSKRSGHGNQTLAKAVANSCNPAFISIGQKLGASKFYDYLEDFGMIGKTGIDMQGEADNSNLVWDRDYFTGPYGVASLATASFGQRFKVTPIQMVTAASAVVNGGHLMQPYVLQDITDPDGNPISHTKPTEVRQVVSEETSARCRTILEGVVKPGGTGNKAYVAGYRIGGKTGSSETDKKDHTIVSFLGFAPADDPKVVILLAFDNPKPVAPGANNTAGGWYISGGNMAAPLAGELLANILDHMGVQKEYTEAEKTAVDVTVPKVTGLSGADAVSALKNQGFASRTVGSGDAVTDQVPAAGAQIPSGSTVVLYLGEEKPTDLVTVPDLTGKTPAQAKAALAEVGLYLKNANMGSDTALATGQTVAKNTQVERGTVVSVTFTVNDAVGVGAGL